MTERCTGVIVAEQITFTARIRCTLDESDQDNVFIPAEKIF